MSDIFNEEEITLQNAKQMLVSKAFESAADAQHYNLLVNEYEKLLNQVRRLVKISDIMELKMKKVSHKLEELSNIDFLTNLANRRYFHKTLEKEWYRSLRYNTSLAIIMIDVDFFKSYNDIYGHLEGDKCLEKLANVLINTLKRPSDIAARYGGEEFIILLPGTDLLGAYYVSERIASCVAELKLPHKGSSINGKVTISIGISAIIPSQEYVPDVLISMADEALYCAKRDGRNCIKVNNGTR